jgi:hypothetical protein
VLGVTGLVATLLAPAVHADVSWGPGLAASGAASGAASSMSSRKIGRSWLTAIGLGSFWLPLAVGAILSLIWIFR